MKRKIAILSVIIVAVVIIGILISKLPQERGEGMELPIETTEESTEIKYKVPESPVSHVMEAEGKEREIVYSDTTICATFDQDIRDMCTEVFGEYLMPLQEPYRLLEEAGYEYFVAFYSDEYTCVKVPGESLEFNIYLPGARGRFSISKSGDVYTTTFRILKDDEYQTPVETEEDNSIIEETVHYGFNQNIPQPIIPGYVSVNDSLGQLDYVLFDGDEISDRCSSIIDKVREVWGTDDALCDLLNYKYEISGDTALGILKINDDGTQITYGNYLFVLGENENGITTDVYKKK